MRRWPATFDYRFWCSEVAAIRGRGPETQRELLAELAFWSLGCAPEIAMERVITANNCYARGDRLPVRWERMARAYGELRDGASLPRHGKREAFAKALARHALGGGQAIPLKGPIPEIDPWPPGKSFA